jgi:hypothetical protein
MRIYNSIIKDFKENVLTQFIGVITFGFGVTAFYGVFFNYILNNQIIFSSKDFVFLMCSFLGYFISLYFVNNKENIKNKLIKSFDFIITVLGFVMMFVPFIVISEQGLIDMSFKSMLIENSIISLVISVLIFLLKSIVKTILKL